MHVVLGIRRGIEVHHRIHAVDMDSPCRHIGGDQSIDSTPDERIQRLLSLLLAAVTVDGRSPDPALLQLPSDPVRAVLGPAEHDGRTRCRSDLRGPLDPVA